MVAILLVALGIPLWLVAGMLLGTLCNRRRFKHAPEAFRCKVRLVSGTGRSLKTTSGRMPGYARWVHEPSKGDVVGRRPASMEWE